MTKSESTYENPAFDEECVDEGFSKDLNEDKTKTNEAKYDNSNEEDRLKELRSIKWNLALIAISGLLSSSPMLALMSSTTSLLDDEGLGITSLAASSVAQFLGSAFLLAYANKILGMRKMVSITLILPIAFTVSYVYPSWATTFPSAILLGLGLASLTSMFMYGNAIGFYYAQLTKGNSETILVVITGFLSSCFGGGIILGNAVLFAVLSIGSEEENTTISAVNNSYELCGAQYCNEELKNMTTMRKPETFRYYTLVGIFTAMALLAGILSLFIRDFSNELGCILRKKSEYFTILKETLGLLGRPRGYLLIILTIFMGLEQAFVSSTYTHAYISCTVGIPKVGLIMLAYGGTQVIICCIQGLFVQLFGRIVLIVFGVASLLGCCVAVLLWHPLPDQLSILFAVAIIWAASDAIMVPSVFAMYSILFEDNIEGSLSLGTFWWAVGYMIAFIWSQFLCVTLKLYITIAFGCAGLIGYILLEIIVYKNASKTSGKAET